MRSRGPFLTGESVGARPDQPVMDAIPREGTHAHPPITSGHSHRGAGRRNHYTDARSDRQAGNSPDGQTVRPVQANAGRTSSGIFTVDPATGTDVTIIQGFTSGPYDVPGSDSFNAVVTGPGAFAPNLAVGRPDGLAIVRTLDTPLATTDPMPFTFGSNFRDLAQELGPTIVPGDYVVNLRCANGFEATVFPIYTMTITFPSSTRYVVVDNPSAAELPSGGALKQGIGEALAGGQPPPDTAVAPEAESSEPDDSNVILIVLVAVPILLNAAYRVAVRRFPDQPVMSPIPPGREHMRILKLVATGTATLVAGTGALPLGLVVALTTAPTGSPFGPPEVNVQPPSGTFAPDPPTGSDVTIVNGVTNGTCDVPGTEAVPVDGYNTVVTRHGAFAPNTGSGRPDGLAVAATTYVGFSTTDPLPFVLRGNFRDFARDLGTTLIPSDYVVPFRRVNQFDGVVYQIFSATLTVTTPTAYTVMPGAPTPTTNVPTTTRPALAGTGGDGTGTGADLGDGLASTGAPVESLFMTGLALSVLGSEPLLAARCRRTG